MKVTWAFKAEAEDRDYICDIAKRLNIPMTDFMAKMLKAFRDGEIAYQHGVFIGREAKERVDQYFEGQEKEYKWKLVEAEEKIKKYDDLKAENDYLKRRNKSLEMTQDGAERIVEKIIEKPTEKPTVQNFPENKKDVDLTQLYKMAEKRQITPQSILDRALKMYR